VEPGFAYLRLERFSRNAGEEVRLAIRDLKSRSELTGLVLDVRGNPGGLLDAAVDVAGKFLPRGSLIVSTRGRGAGAEKPYHSTDEPVLPSTPMVVLTDRSSASASEIVAGSLQDLDRAVIVGERTFGKGLVQTIVPLNYGSQLKITTARYYTPSGRSIQEIDYLHRDRDGVFTTVPDSLRRRFLTAHGRPVYEYGGITPDSVVEDTDPGPMVRELQRRSLFFTFINRAVGRGGRDSTLTMTDSLVQAFRRFLEEEKFAYTEQGEDHLSALRESSKEAHFDAGVVAEIDRLASALEREKVRGFDRYRDHIEDALRVEMMARVRGVPGRIEASFRSDPQLRTALGLLKNTRLYSLKIAASGG
jgi:carboxyl-terminal processing protease